MKPTIITSAATVTITMVALCFAAVHSTAVSAAEASPSPSSSFLRGGRTRSSSSRDLEGFRDDARVGGSSMAADSVKNRLGESSSSSMTPNSLVIAASEEEDAAEDDTTEPCTVHVTLTCPVEEPITINNDCIDPFKVMAFRYNGGDCTQSDNLQPRHEFACTDSSVNPPPSTVQGTENYIVVTSRDSGNSETYFAGPVAVGGEYTLNANEEFSVLSGAMTITVYDSEEGDVLQTTELLLDCSNSLFLFDKFGASQVTAWKETTGRVVSSAIDTKRTGSVGVTVNNRDSTTPIRLTEMTLLANTQDEPIDYTGDVEDKELQPEADLQLPSFDFEYDLTTRTRYTFFTTVIAEPLDNDNENGSSPSSCNSYAFIECIL